MVREGLRRTLEYGLDIVRMSNPVECVYGAHTELLKTMCGASTILVKIL